MLERSWVWLQDPEIKALTDTPDFTRDMQRSWFESLPRRSDYFVWGIEIDGTPIGAFGLKQVTAEDAEYWGYLGERSYWGRGIGQWMLHCARDEARRLGLARLRLRVLRENARAIAAYRRFGFRSDGDSGPYFLMSLSV
jgi:RimJ/RimL family protein N-acetyltransferase